MKYLILTLEVLILITFFSIILRYSIKIFRNRTQINQFLIISFLSLGFGTIYDAYRILSILFFGFINEYIDKIGFVLKIFLYFFGTSIFIHILLIYSRQSGHITKKDGIINTTYFILTPLISILNSFTFIQTNINEYGFYFYQIHPLFFLLTLATFSPLFPYTIFKVRELKSEITHKEMKTQINICISVFLIIEIEKTVNSIFYFLYNNSIYVLIANLLMILAYTLAFIFTLFLKYPDFLNAISTYFSIKSIYIVGNNGVIFYEFDFQKESSKDTLTSREILLGGFLYIIDIGLDTLFDIKEDVKTITIGNMNLVFTHRKYVFGIILTTEYTSIMFQKLGKFIEQFENNYKKELKDFSGDLDVFNSTKIRNWTIEFFR